MLELWGNVEYPSLPSPLDSLWPRVVAPDMVLSMGQIELFDSVRQWPGRPGFNPRSSHTKDFKNGT